MQAHEGAPARWQCIRERLLELEANDRGDARLERFVWVINGLLHHNRFGDLSDREVRRLEELGHALLAAQEIQPRSSKLSHLFGDIHIIVSQIERRRGQHWQSAWQQALALQLAGQEPSGGEAFQLLVQANRSLRLGDGPGAANYLRRVLAQLRDRPSWFARLALSCRQVDWLGGTAPGAPTLCEQLPWLDQPGFNREEELEWQWLQLIVQADAGRPQRLLQAVRRQGSHYQSTYLIEACLWRFAAAGRIDLSTLPQLPNLKRHKRLAPQQLGAWYRLSARLFQIFDQDRPVLQRQQLLGDLLATRHELVAVEQELLILAAAGRWLAQVKAPSLAVTVLAEYYALGQRLTGGRRHDALQTLGDMETRPWWQEAFGRCYDARQSTP